jgi:MinD superfamily P-loop ATPase
MNKAKKRAILYFSRYIRTRDALKTTGTTTYAKCITCGNIQHISDMDAGHVIPGRDNAILFSEDLCNAQCRVCNRFHGGRLQEYKKVLIEVYGLNKWEEWEAMKHTHVKFTQADYEELAAKYRDKTKKLIIQGDDNQYNYSE